MFNEKREKISLICKLKPLQKDWLSLYF